MRQFLDFLPFSCDWAGKAIPLTDIPAFVARPRWKRELKSFWKKGRLKLFFMTIIFRTHYRRLKEVKPYTKIAVLYRVIMLLPQVFAGTALAGLLIPRAEPFWEFLRTSTEALELYTFLMVLLMLMATEGGKGKGYVPWGEELEESKSAISSLHATKIWSVPPFGCLCKPCEKRKKVTNREVRIGQNLVSQYMYCAPALSFMSILIELQISSNEFESVAQEEMVLIMKKLVNLLKVVSMFTAVYGLFVLYVVTEYALLDFKTTAKFASIKVLVILEKATDYTLKLLSMLFGVDVLTNQLSTAYDSEARRSIFVSFVTVIESLFLTMLMIQAFPASDLQVAHTLRMAGAKPLAAESTRKKGTSNLMENEDVSEQEDNNEEDNEDNDEEDEVGMRKDHERPTRYNVPETPSVLTEQDEEILRKANVTWTSSYQNLNG
eukprot:g30844.t1